MPAYGICFEKPFAARPPGASDAVARALKPRGYYADMLIERCSQFGTLVTDIGLTGADIVAMECVPGVLHIYPL